MAKPKLAKLELQIMEALWTRSHASIREMQETFPEKDSHHRLASGNEQSRAAHQEGWQLPRF
jgi:predicted transcriptional regulator